MSEQYLARTTSFVRRGERMTRSQDRAWREHAEHFVAPLRRTDSRTTVDPDERLNLDALFGGRGGDLGVEIGTGTGDQIVHAATQRPDRRYLGFEVWRPGIAQAIVKAQHAGVDNVRFVEADAEQALRTLLPDASARPAGVGAMPRPDFSNKVRPVSRWSAVMCWLTALGL